MTHPRFLVPESSTADARSGARVADALRRVLCCAVMLVIAALPAAAQTAATVLPTDSSRPFEIEDNSFFVEEAFNQEAGIVQTIVGSTFLVESGWAATITQEWPVPAMRHQLSFTVPFGRVNGETGPGDVAVNYRYQLLEEKPGQPALAPRLTVLMPTGSTSRGLGTGAWGLQFNVPASKQVRDFYFHGNAGATWYPSATFTGASAPGGSPGDDRSCALTSPFIAVPPTQVAGGH